MDLKAPVVKCKGKNCGIEFQINEIRKHLAKKQSCKKEYSTEEYEKLGRQYEIYRKKNRAANFQRQKIEPRKVKHYWHI